MTVLHCHNLHLLSFVSRFAAYTASFHQAASGISKKLATGKKETEVLSKITKFMPIADDEDEFKEDEFPYEEGFGPISKNDNHPVPIIKNGGLRDGKHETRSKIGDCSYHKKNGDCKKPMAKKKKELDKKDKKKLEELRLLSENMENLFEKFNRLREPRRKMETLNHNFRKTIEFAGSNAGIFEGSTLCPWETPASEIPSAAVESSASAGSIVFDSFVTLITTSLNQNRHPNSTDAVNSKEGLPGLEKSLQVDRTDGNLDGTKISKSHNNYIKRASHILKKMENTEKRLNEVDLSKIQLSDVERFNRRLFEGGRGDKESDKDSAGENSEGVVGRVLLKSVIQVMNKNVEEIKDVWSFSQSSFLPSQQLSQSSFLPSQQLHLTKHFSTSHPTSAEVLQLQQRQMPSSQKLTLSQLSAHQLLLQQRLTQSPPKLMLSQLSAHQLLQHQQTPTASISSSSSPPSSIPSSSSTTPRPSIADPSEIADTRSNTVDQTIAKHLDNDVKELEDLQKELKDLVFTTDHEVFGSSQKKEEAPSRAVGGGKKTEQIQNEKPEGAAKPEENAAEHEAKPGENAPEAGAANPEEITKEHEANPAESQNKFPFKKEEIGPAISKMFAQYEKIVKTYSDVNFFYSSIPSQNIDDNIEDYAAIYSSANTLARALREPSVVTAMDDCATELAKLFEKNTSFTALKVFWEYSEAKTHWENFWGEMGAPSGGLDY